MRLTLGTDSAARKDIPVYSGFVQYFPAAIAGAARHSKRGNDKHNPGEPLHHARGKSMDHEDCIERHLMDISDMEAAIKRQDFRDDGQFDPASVKLLLEEADALVWRSAALSQRLYETYGGAPLAPGARLPGAEPGVVGWAKNTLTDGDVVSVEGVSGTFTYSKDFPFELNQE